MAVLALLHHGADPNAVADDRKTSREGEHSSPSLLHILSNGVPMFTVLATTHKHPFLRIPQSATPICNKAHRPCCVMLTRAVLYFQALVPYI